MIVLSTTDDVLRVVAAAANAAALQSIASYREVSASVYVPSRHVASPAASSTTTIVTAPASSRYHIVDQILLYNPADTFAQFRVELFDGANAYILWNGRVPPKGRLQYTDATGFKVLSDAGIVEKAALWQPAANEWHTLVLQREVTLAAPNLGGSAGSTLIVPELVAKIPKNRPCLYELVVNLEVNATTTGAGAGIAGFPINFFGDLKLVVAYGGVQYRGLTTSTHSFAYGAGMSSSAFGTDSPVAAAASGQNMIRGYGTIWGLEQDMFIQAGICVENAASAVIKAKPGSMFKYAYGPEITP